jgi:mannitol/fructose-specific phosphotransferase system IIA component (Ntr-type)
MDINILDYLNKDSICLGIQQKNKKGILTAILDHLIVKKKIKKENKSVILKSLLQREQMGSTAIGGCIAFPHARLDNIKDLIICFAVSRRGVDFESLDQEPVNIIALLLSNQKEAGRHLKMLAFLARMLRDKYFVQKIKGAANQEEVLALIAQQEQAVR